MEREGLPSEDANGCAAHAAVSLGASILGSLIGTIAFVGWDMATSPFPERTVPVENILFVGTLVLFIGSLIGIPAGLIAGVALLSHMGPLIRRHRLVMSLLLGLIGLAGGWIIGSAVGSAERSAGLFFGFAIGALHGILYPAERQRADEQRDI